MKLKEATVKEVANYNTVSLTVEFDPEETDTKAKILALRRDARRLVEAQLDGRGDAP